jgi:hypothetical protein
MQIFDLSVSCAASLIVLFCVEELGARYSFAVYGVISVLSMLLLPQKWIAIYFILFFGLMPVTKKIYEKTGKIFSWVLKILTFDLELICFYFVARELDFFAENEKAVPYLAAMFVLTNAVFVLTDVLYGKLSFIYKIKYQHRVKKFLK